MNPDSSILREKFTRGRSLESEQGTYLALLVLHARFFVV